jgi:dienelactone hydrolase
VTSNAHTWTDEFPANFKWSNATLVCKGMAPYGVVAIEEIERICTALRARESEPDVWAEEWTGMASLLEQRADAAEAAGRHHAAGTFYMRAGNYYYTGERMVTPGDAKLAIYRKALHCYREGIRRRYPQVEPVDVPLEDTALAAYFVPAERVKGPAPTVLLFNGMDNCKEMSVVFAAVEFARRGINALAIDGPGQGESLRLRGIYARPDYEVAGSAAYEWLAKRPEVDPSRVVVMGYSMGGYYAPRVAAFDHRFAGCVAFGAMHPDFHAWQLHMKAQQDASLSSSSQSNFQLQFILGIDNWEKAMEVARKFTLEQCAADICCPVLILHGEDDRVVPLSAAHALQTLIGTDRAMLKIFTSEEGANEHCQVDDRQQGIDFITDWIEVTLGRALSITGSNGIV